VNPRHPQRRRPGQHLGEDPGQPAPERRVLQATAIILHEPQAGHRRLRARRRSRQPREVIALPVAGRLGSRLSWLNAPSGKKEDRIRIRVCEHNAIMPGPGGDGQVSETCTLITTVLDWEAAPADQVRDAYIDTRAAAMPARHPETALTTRTEHKSCNAPRTPKRLRFLVLRSPARHRGPLRLSSFAPRRTTSRHEGTCHGWRGEPPV